MHRNCAECRQLWERYFAAAVEEFGLQERMETTIRLNDTQTAKTLVGSAGDARKKMFIRIARDRTHNQIDELRNIEDFFGT